MGTLRLLYRRLDRIRGSRSWRHFKAKFAPRWEPRHLAVPNAAALPKSWWRWPAFAWPGRLAA